MSDWTPYDKPKITLRAGIANSQPVTWINVKVSPVLTYAVTEWEKAKTITNIWSLPHLDRFEKYRYTEAHLIR